MPCAWLLSGAVEVLRLRLRWSHSPHFPLKPSDKIGQTHCRVPFECYPFSVMSISASSCLSQPPTVTFNLSVRTYKFYCTHLSVCLLVCLPGSRNLGGLYVCTLLCLRDYISLRLLPLQNEQLPNRLHAIRCLNCLKVI